MGQNEKGFTLIEMMIVLMIISILLFITLPNVTNNNKVVKSKGCEAMIKLVEAQIQAYEIEHDTKPADLTILIDDGYIQSAQCPDGSPLLWSGDKVTAGTS